MQPLAGPHGAAPTFGKLQPPRRVARILALVLSLVAIVFAILFGIYLRRVYPIFDQDNPDAWILPGIWMLVFLLFAMLFRMAASICELVWLERTWSNLPPELCNVGPMKKVSSGIMLVLCFVPGLAWIWKLGLAIAVCDAFEAVRPYAPFEGKVPKRLGLAAVVLGWIPGPSVYIAPFLWEIFATKMDRCMSQILAGVPADRRT